MEGGDEKLIVVPPEKWLDGFELNEKPFKDVKSKKKGCGCCENKLKLFLPWVYITLYGSLHYMAYIWSRHAFKVENNYSMNHYMFNDMIC